MRKKPKFSSLLFALFIVLMIVPQTRKVMQVAVNKAKVLVWSPSTIAKEDQKQLATFAYQLSDLNGAPKTVTIGEGKATFISYWATWCPPCIAELPSIEKLYNDYGEQVNFLLITDEEPEKVRRFLQEKGYQLPAYIPRLKAPKALFSRSIPTSYLIDGNGAILIKETGAADWNSEQVRAVLEALVTL